MGWLHAEEVDFLSKIASNPDLPAMGLEGLSETEKANLNGRHHPQAHREDWTKFLGDVPATTAILDRFLAHAEILPMQGKSYRLHQRAKRSGKSGKQGYSGCSVSVAPDGCATGRRRGAVWFLLA
jgi:hypothetical protein